jgi:hypothetical protein
MIMRELLVRGKGAHAAVLGAALVCGWLVQVSCGTSSSTPAPTIVGTTGASSGGHGLETAPTNRKR